VKTGGGGGVKTGRRLPHGTVTFLFTDIEGSSRNWEEDAAAANRALARHDNLFEALVAHHEGTVVRPRGEGDSRFAVFTQASRAIAAALDIQRAFTVEPWPTRVPLRVRLAVHTGEASVRAGDYYGTTVNRCARLRSIANGGQILVTRVTAELAGAALPDGVSLRDMGLHRLKDLAEPEHVLQLDHPDLPPEFPPLKSLSTQATNLPLQVTRFVGRERELNEIRRLLTNTRLLTLTGPGGVGKTRLALHVAADLVDAFDDGVWLVELASLLDGSLVHQAVASALRLREEPRGEFAEHVLDYLRSKRVLLVLDNCEHLVDSCAKFADNLVRSCANVQVLATSREPLLAAAEVAWRVPSMRTPSPRGPVTAKHVVSYEAARLFVERSSASDREFQLTDATAPALAEICRRLDGMPLALELAAAAARALGIEHIRDRLDDRFRLLVNGNRTAPSRQQTLRATLDWSFELLTAAERTLFVQLSVFAGGWTLEAAERVCASGATFASDVLELLTRLVDKSLVTVESNQDGTVRYRMLETVRQYAGERLEKRRSSALARRQHALFFTSLAEHSYSELRGPRQRQFLTLLEREHDNLRAALAWCAYAGEAELGLRLAEALTRFWQMHGYLTEGRHWVSAALEQGASTAHALRARALSGAGMLALNQDDFCAAETYNAESLRLSEELDDKWGVATALNGLASAVRAQGDKRRARDLYKQSLNIARELGDGSLMAPVLVNIGAVEHDVGDLDGSARALREAARLFREIGARDGLAYAINRLAAVARRAGDYEAAEAFGEEALAIFRELGHKVGVTWALLGLGTIARHVGNHALARSRYEEALALAHELKSRDRIASTLLNLGQIAVADGDYATARDLLQRSLALFRELGVNIDISVALAYLGQTAQAQGDLHEACTLYRECVAGLCGVQERPEIPGPLEKAAALISAAGDASAAARLLGAAAALRDSMHMPVPPSHQSQYGSIIAKTRAAAGSQTFARAWAAGSETGIEDALNDALKTLDALYSRNAPAIAGGA
jgi:predicted ATPase/class 3 adenylate cyclase